jgi:serine/threonine protein kinase
MIREYTEQGDALEIPLTFGRYSYLQTIGTGGCAVVVLVADSQTAQHMACKIVSKKRLADEQILRSFIQEIEIMQSLRHPHVVQFHEVLYTDALVYIIMEYCASGELISLLGQEAPLPCALRSQIICQLLTALAFLHANGIAHRDIKPDNILLDADKNVKLGDFGFSRRVNGAFLMQTPCGSPDYVAPEILLGKDYDGLKADIWSVGVVLFVLETGRIPWTARSNTMLFQQITSGLFQIPISVARDVAEIIDHCLQVDPARRPSAFDLLASPYFKQVEAAVPAIHASRATIPRPKIPKTTTSILSQTYKQAVARSAVYRHRLGAPRKLGDGEVQRLPALAQDATRQIDRRRVSAVSSFVW